MNEVRFTTTLRPRDVAVVSLRLLVLHPISITLMAAGPLLMLLGSMPGGDTVYRLGSTMVWLVVLVPVYGLLIASWTAYRPGATPIYDPAEWTFSDDGIWVTQPGRDAKAEWSEFTGWRSVAGCLLLHTAPTRYVVLPWRDLAPQERDALEALLTEHLGARKR
jgi:hypothetical protein